MPCFQAVVSQMNYYKKKSISHMPRNFISFEIELFSLAFKIEIQHMHKTQIVHRNLRTQSFSQTLRLHHPMFSLLYDLKHCFPQLFLNVKYEFTIGTFFFHHSELIKLKFGEIVKTFPYIR